MNFSDFNFEAGETLLFNKPINWTSFDVVNKVRWLISNKLKSQREPVIGKQPRLKVGHAGTLDPLASGLLLICTGKSTRSIDLLQNQDKEYIGSITFGGITPSYDLESEISETFDASGLTEAKVVAATKLLTGTIMQLPPPFSARSVNGVRAYTIARKGQDPGLSPREVLVTEFETDFSQFNNTKMMNFRVRCSKGTYIRSLAHDLGKLVNNGAFLSSLCRTKIGNYELSNSWEVEKFAEMINK